MTTTTMCLGIESRPLKSEAGTGAYLVQVASIPVLLEHLRSRPIRDIDQMMLAHTATSSYCPYEIWPYAVQLGWHHWHHVC